MVCRSFIRQYAKLLKANFTKSELIYLLVKADKEMGVYAPSGEWHSYYASFF